MEDQVALALQIDKGLIVLEDPIDLFKDKIVQDLIIDLEEQLALDPLIEALFKIGLVLAGQMEDQTVLIIVQVFHLG